MRARKFTSAPTPCRKPTPSAALQILRCTSISQSMPRNVTTIDIQPPRPIHDQQMYPRLLLTSRFPRSFLDTCTASFSTFPNRRTSCSSQRPTSFNFHGKRQMPSPRRIFAFVLPTKALQDCFHLLGRSEMRAWGKISTTSAMSCSNCSWDADWIASAMSVIPWCVAAHARRYPPRPPAWERRPSVPRCAAAPVSDKICGTGHIVDGTLHDRLRDALLGAPPRFLSKSVALVHSGCAPRSAPWNIDDLLDDTLRLSRLLKRWCLRSTYAPTRRARPHHQLRRRTPWHNRYGLEKRQHTKTKVTREPNTQTQRLHASETLERRWPR